MKDWTKYLPKVQPEVGMCPPELALEEIRNAAIEFCERSRCWMVIQDPYPVGGKEMSYDFDADNGAVVWLVDHAELDDRNELLLRSPAWCDDEYPGWRRGEITGAPAALTQLDPESFILVPAPDVTREVTLTVALKPTRDSPRGPDFLFNDYYEGIAAGAKSRLMLMKDKPWTDAQQGAAYMAFFNEKVDEAALRREKAWGRATIRVKPDYF